MFVYNNWLLENPMGEKQRESLKSRFQPNASYEAETQRRIKEFEKRQESDSTTSNKSHDSH